MVSYHSNIKNILIFCGGPSVEHEVSLRSARYIASIVPEGYQAHVVGLTRQHTLHYVSSDALCSMRECIYEAETEVSLKRTSGGVVLGGDHQLGVLPVHMAFPVMHGALGEDGALQGFLEFLGVPYIGSGVLGSALAMSKRHTKQLLALAGIPVLPHIALEKYGELTTYEEASHALQSKVLVVKPCSKGSSVGVHKVDHAAAYQGAVMDGFQYDHSLLVEPYCHGQEVECAVLGHRNLMASGVGEIITGEDSLYSYRAKYLCDHLAKVEVHAQLSQEILEDYRQLSLKAFKTLGLSGLARVDGFFTKDGLFINECNTLPGFTSISLYPKLWEAKGISGKQLLSMLILCAEERFQEERGLKLLPEDLLHSDL